MERVAYRDLGLIGYEECFALQRDIFDKLIASKTTGEYAEQCLILCEHPHVYTLGKSGQENNLLVNSEFLSKIGATYCRTDRGGDITYHGPGQIVGYPVFDLERVGMGLREYIHGIEEAVILALSEYGIAAGRSAGATGVWLEGPARKICAIGVRSSRYVTMHGFALNVNTLLEYFSWINPCGFTDRGVTSMERELGGKQDIGKIKLLLARKLENIMNIKIDYYGDRKEMGAQAPG